MRALSPAEELALDAAPRWATRRPPPGLQPSCGPDVQLRTWDSYANLAPARPLSYSFKPARRAGKASIAAAMERLLAEASTRPVVPFRETLELADAVGLRLDPWQRVLLREVFAPPQNGRAPFRFHGEGPGWSIDGWHDPSAGSR